MTVKQLELVLKHITGKDGVDLTLRLTGSKYLNYVICLCPCFCLFLHLSLSLNFFKPQGRLWLTQLVSRVYPLGHSLDWLDSSQMTTHGEKGLVLGLQGKSRCIEDFLGGRGVSVAEREDERNAGWMFSTLPGQEEHHTKRRLNNQTVPG